MACVNEERERERERESRAVCFMFYFLFFLGCVKRAQDVFVAYKYAFLPFNFFSPTWTTGARRLGSGPDARTGVGGERSRFAHLPSDALNRVRFCCPEAPAVDGYMLAMLAFGDDKLLNFKEPKEPTSASSSPGSSARLGRDRHFIDQINTYARRSECTPEKKSRPPRESVSGGDPKPRRCLANGRTERGRRTRPTRVMVVA